MPDIEVDILRIRQILTNYLGNAVKFTPKGSVTLHAELEMQPDGKGTLRFHVADTGIGIDEDNLKHLEDPFVQVAEAQSHGGAGLGLAICKSMIACMGGTTWIRSRLGEGSTFGVVVPNLTCYSDASAQSAASSADTAVPPSTAPQPVGTAALSQLKALLVDDVEMNLKILSAMCRKIGVSNLLFAHDGVEAMKVLEAEPVSLVLTDLWMPNMDGVGLVQAIRSQESLKGLPVYAVTADTDFQKQENAALFTEILLKPISLEKMREIFYK
jgi:CheY-like chemotaxis protein